MAASEASERLALVRQVQDLQRALEETNAKMAATRTENAELVMENRALSEYIDSLSTSEALTTMHALHTGCLFAPAHPKRRFESHISQWQMSHTWVAK
jgi:regulator of replication initiation timing